MDTPTPDANTNFITPSPTANECQLPKAPKARKVHGIFVIFLGK